MDYIKLKKTLMAVFDHFLSCHDKHDLEKMMQAFEAGKGLNIRLPEKIHRSDYKDDLQFMNVSKPKVVRSRVRKTKPKESILADDNTSSLEHVFNVPIMMKLTRMDKKQCLMLKDLLTRLKHKIMFKNTLIDKHHGVATAVISRVVQKKRQRVLNEEKTDISASFCSGRGNRFGEEVSSHDIVLQTTDKNINHVIPVEVM